MAILPDTRRRRVIALVAILGILVCGPGVYELVRLSWMEWRLNQRLAALSAQHQQLLEEQQRLQSDPTYVEGLIRSTFKLARPGELVIPLQDDHGD